MTALKPGDEAVITRFFKELSENICPHCHVAIAKQEQVGRCVYARPCGHRLYQGTVGAFSESPKGAA